MKKDYIFQALQDIEESSSSKSLQERHTIQYSFDLELRAD